MNEIRIAAIVEGYGDVEAVPLLIRRITGEIDPAITIDIHSLRVPACKLIKTGELERTVELAARKLGGDGGILILIDCDWDGGCPKTDAHALLNRARSTRSDMLISVVLAYKEYEAWFIAAAESLRGKRGLSETLTSVDNPEQIRGAKEWLSHQMPSNHSYSETLDQPALTALFDMQSARRANSFDKCYREIVFMINRLKADLD
ncbi:MAG: DUF4276 family protein [Candidatus Latescibacter sp.]|nr:DUF4276 family protein [Candidatus Latescibacter sp.]